MAKEGTGQTTGLFTRFREDFGKTGYAAKSAAAKAWFFDKANELRGKINRKRLLRDELATPKTKPRLGCMYMYAYDPKTKETLPYYDRFPLIILVQPAPGGFHGLNLHYLEPTVRALFLDKLFATMGGSKLTENTRLKIRYSLLSSAKRFELFAPCFKHYLLDHVVSRIVEVNPLDWATALYLPSENFAKASKQRVWKDSFTNS